MAIKKIVENEMFMNPTVDYLKAKDLQRYADLIKRLNIRK